MFLEVQEVSKAYKEGQESAVKGISFEVREEEIIALVGESGCGKTTLMRMLAGLVEPDEGKIYLEDEWVKGPAHKLVPGHEAIELVTQSCELFDYLTVFDNVAHFIELFDKEYRQERVTELLTLCRIGQYAQKYPTELSGGEQQRLAIARALAKEPALLLLDEPFSHLDAHLKNSLMEDLVEVLRESGTTTIMVTHDPQDALRLADRILMIQKGTLIQEDTPQTIYQKPKDEYVASLFGEPNILPAALLTDKLKKTPTGKRACTRIEDWKIVSEDKSDFTGMVLRSYYLGAYYQLDVKLEGQKLVRVNSEKAYEVQKKIGLSLKKNKIHWID